MSKLRIGLRLYIISIRWIVLLSLFLFHIKWDHGYSIGYSLLIGFNLLFSFMHSRKIKDSIWKVSIILEVLILLLVNSMFSIEMAQLLYLYTSLLMLGIFISRKDSILFAFIYSVLALLLSLELFRQPPVEKNPFTILFPMGFIFYLLLCIVMENIIIDLKKWLILSRYTEKLSRIQSMKILHDMTEDFVKKLLRIPKCYLCLYTNDSFQDDWYSQYYTRLLLGDGVYRFNRKKRVIRIDNYLGEQERFLFVPIRFSRSNENAGGLLIPLEKKLRLNRFDFIFLRILLSSFLNYKHLLDLQLEQTASMKAEVRNKMAQDMHDGLAQQLFFLSAQVYQVKNNVLKGNYKNIDTLIMAMEKQASSCQNEVRSFIADLKGEKRESNIYDAIGQLVNRLTYNTSVKINMEYQGKLTEETVEIEEAVYRLIEESINNILKHAKASTISILIDVTIVQWTIKIVDDGIGFDHVVSKVQKSGSYGLTGIRERVVNLGGHLSLNSKIGTGTEIVAVIPKGRVNAYA
jgi:signal transduction histidine kinase